MDATDRFRQRLICDLSRRGSTLAPLVEASARDLQFPARHRDGDPVTAELEDEPETYFGSMSSRAK